MSQTVEGAPGFGRGGGERLTEHHAAQHYAAIVESSDDAILSKDLNGVIMSWNRGAQRLFGYTAEEAVGRPVTILIPADRPNEEPMILERIRRGDRIDHYETIRRRKDGSFVDISLTVSPIRNQQGEIVGASKIARDITELNRARQRQELLLREMDHRVKNLFALAISVLNLSGRSAASVPEVIRSAGDRLSALARAHALTLSHGPKDVPQAAKPATLHTLIGAITAPHDARFDSDGSRFSVIGCDMEISGAVISSLALLLQEFATNSTKYGALSATAGRVQIHCANHGETLVVTWTERGGPEVVRRRGTTASVIFSFAPRLRGLEATSPGTGSPKASSSGSLCRAIAWWLERSAIPPYATLSNKTAAESPRRPFRASCENSPPPTNGD